MGQPIEAWPIEWQSDNSSGELIYRQKLRADKYVYWSSFHSPVKYYYLDISTGKFIQFEQLYGEVTQFNQWIPRYVMSPFLNILMTNEFKSISRAEKNILIALVGMAGNSGEVNNTTVRHLADLTSYSKDTTIRHIDSLKASKLIREKSKVSKIKKKGILQEKLPRKKVLLTSEI